MKVPTKQFTLAETLGVMHGYLLEDNGFSRLHEAMEWIANRPIFTHEIPRVADDLQAALGKQFPKLMTPRVIREIKRLVKSIKSKNKLNEICRWNKLISLYGNIFEVQPMQPFDKMEEFTLPDKNVIILVKDDDSLPEYI